MKRWLLSMMLFVAASGCGVTPRELAHSVVLHEQRTIAVRDPEELPAIPIPDNASPRTVTNTRPDLADWNLSLDDAIRIGLERTRVVRVLAGVTATTSGKTIYDAAITNTTIDQAQATFDPKLTFNNQWYRNNVPFALLNPVNPGQALITSSPASAYLGSLGMTQTNVLGGQWSATWTENPTHFGGLFNPNLGFNGVPLNPQDTRSVNLAYTQPLLLGGGFRVNMAPVVIARLNTEASFFQYKDSVQELVRGIVEAYWNLVNARTDAWAKRIQVQLSEAAYLRERARLEAGLADAKDVAQARVTYTQFKANLVAADAQVLNREGALRNILGLPPADDKYIVPVSPPTTERLRPVWASLVQIAEATRPDIIELKIIIEAEQQRLIQAENQMLPQLNAFGNYQFNGLTGVMPNNDSISTGPGQYQNWTIGVNFSVPLGLRQGRALVRQERLLIDKDRANLQQGLHQAIHELTLSVRDLDSFYEQYLAYKEARAAAEINVKVQGEKFRTGQNIYLNVLQALNDWGTSVTSEVQALINYNVALATLERRTGTILQTHGLIFNEERMRTLGPFGLKRAYPAALPPVGQPQNYPASTGPAENSFNLVSPYPQFKGPPPQLLPPE